MVGIGIGLALPIAGCLVSPHELVSSLVVSPRRGEQLGDALYGEGYSGKRLQLLKDFVLDAAKVEDVDVGCQRDLVDRRGLEVVVDNVLQLGPEQPLDLGPGEMRATGMRHKLEVTLQ